MGMEWGGDDTFASAQRKSHGEYRSGRQIHLVAVLVIDADMNALLDVVTEGMVLPVMRISGNPIKRHEEVLSLQPMIPPKRFDIPPP